MPSPTAKTSLSAPSGSATPSRTQARKVSDYEKMGGLNHTPNAAGNTGLPSQCIVKPLSIAVEDTPGRPVAGFLHRPSTYNHEAAGNTAAILLSGAGGGVVGPSSIYLSMADKLASLKNGNGLPVLRLDYRFPARNRHCVRDVYAGMDLLEREYGVSRFVLVGWSFGGAPVFTVGGAEKERVVGCATIASQTAETDGIEDLSPRPVLLLHGTADKTLSQRCSENLYRAYGPAGDRRIELFEGDDHALSRNALKAEEMLCRFVMKCAGTTLGDGEETVLKKELVGGADRIDLMKKGGDLNGAESVK